MFQLLVKLESMQGLRLLMIIQTKVWSDGFGLLCIWFCDIWH